MKFNWKYYYKPVWYIDKITFGQPPAIDHSRGWTTGKFIRLKEGKK
jgi:hypothetical protein